MIPKDNLKTIFNAFFWLAIVSLFFALFWQNSVLTQSWNYLFFRQSDDYAMLLSIKSIQKDLMDGHVAPLISSFWYGYGFEFWGGYSLVTLPFGLLDSSIAMQLAARLISVAAFFAAIYFAAKIFSLFCRDEYLKKIFALFLLFSPIIPEWSTRINVNPLTLVWGTLGLYMFLKYKMAMNLDRKNLAISAICVGAAIGGKLTGVFWVPAFYLLLLNYENFAKNSLTFTFALIPSAIFFAYPKIFLFPFFRQDVLGFFDTLAFYIRYASVNYNSIDLSSPWSNFTEGFGVKFMSPIVLVVLVAMGILYASKSSKKNQKDFLILLLWPVLVLAYLVFTFKKGPGHMAAYFITVYVLLGLGFAGFQILKKYSVTAAFALLILHVCLQFGPFRETLLAYSDRGSSEVFKQQDEINRDLKVILGSTPPKDLYFIRPAFTILPYSSFDAGFIDQMSEPMNLLGDSCGQGRANFIMIKTGTIPTIESLDSHAQGRDLFEKSRHDTLAFLDTGLCGGSHYEKVLEKYGTVVFRKTPELTK